MVQPKTMFAFCLLSAFAVSALDYHLNAAIGADSSFCGSGLSPCKTLAHTVNNRIPRNNVVATLLLEATAAPYACPQLLIRGNMSLSFIGVLDTRNPHMYPVIDFSTCTATVFDIRDVPFLRFERLHFRGGRSIHDPFAAEAAKLYFINAIWSGFSRVNYLLGTGTDRRSLRPTVGTFVNCSFVNNFAIYSAAIDIEGKHQLTFENCTFRHNNFSRGFYPQPGPYTSALMGMIFVYSDINSLVTIKTTTFEDNIVGWSLVYVVYYSFHGRGALSISNCTFQRNSLQRVTGGVVFLNAVQNTHADRVRANITDTSFISNSGAASVFLSWRVICIALRSLFVHQQPQ